MTREVARRIAANAPTATAREIAACWMDLQKRGVELFRFSIGEPDFAPPPHVIEAAKRAIDRGSSRYTSHLGIPPLREAVCAATATAHGFTPTPDQVCISVGAKQALFNVAMALFEPGDEVVIPAPYWPLYTEDVRLAGARAVHVETTEANGWRVAPEALARALTPQTKGLILCSPSNPTGVTYDDAELAALLDVVRASDAWIILDEIYREFVYEGRTCGSAPRIAPDLLDRIVLVSGASKTYGMTGWRVGWTVGPRAVIRAVASLQLQVTNCATSVAQHAACAALTGPQTEVAEHRAAFERRRDAMVEALGAIPGVRCRAPEGAFYAFADLRALYGTMHRGRAIANDEELALWLLEEAHVDAAPGAAFGAPGFFRFSFAVDEERIRAGIGAIRDAALRRGSR